ncbi:MAG: methyltransferase [Candidatus Aenigmarchaeota archaeon]|nr:methyltransferase [Candidatus Aenigmarchaeota archaeon]
MTIKDLLKNKLSQKQLENVPSAFEIIGNKEKAIAVIEIPDSLKNRKKIISQAILEKHKNIKSVLEKKSARKGVFRIRSYRILSGDKDTEVIHKESGCFFKLDPRKTYFSSREGTERLRLSENLKNNENVMVFFAGIGAFPIILKKVNKTIHVSGIEINPKAVKYFEYNCKLNKVDSHIFKGDVRKIVYKKKMEKKYDRIVMPLPESSFEFLKEAFYCLKNGGTCSLYCFSKEEDLKDIFNRIRTEAGKDSKNIEILRTQKVLPYGPNIYKYRIDFKVI